MKINWKIKELETTQFMNSTWYLYNVPIAYYNDNNEKYFITDNSWEARNTEIYVDKGKDTLLVTLGDSWSHGENSEEINHIAKRWEVKDRINIPYGGKLARLLDSDYWTFTCPGQSNSGIFAGLYRILNNIPVNRYKSIKVCIQMVDIGRDNIDLLPDSHKLKKHFEKNSLQKIHIADWFDNYDAIFLDELEEKLDSYKHLPLDIVVFKSINKLNKNKKYSFKLLDISWLQYNAYICGVTLPSARGTSIQFYDTLFENKILANKDIEWINSDLDKWEICVNFLKQNSEVLRGDHPSNLSHNLWAVYIAETMNWAKPCHTD